MSDHENEDWYLNEYDAKPKPKFDPNTAAPEADRACPDCGATSTNHHVVCNRCAYTWTTLAAPKFDPSTPEAKVAFRVIWRKQMIETLTAEGVENPESVTDSLEANVDALVAKFNAAEGKP